jgi:hypothetical protein
MEMEYEACRREGRSGQANQIGGDGEKRMVANVEKERHTSGSGKSQKADVKKMSE